MQRGRHVGNVAVRARLTLKELAADASLREASGPSLEV